jgi:hypothetical protein
MIDRFCKSAAIAALALGIASTAALADGHEVCGIDLTEAVPSATVTGEVKSVGFLVGVRWGNGVLTLHDGEKRRFHILGGKVLETGAAKNVFSGEVYNLKDVADFEGVYYGASQKISIIKSKGEAISNNSNCVVIKIRAVGSGLQLSAPAPGAVEITFID